MTIGTYTKGIPRYLSQIMCIITDKNIIKMVRSNMKSYDLSHPKNMDRAYKNYIEGALLEMK